MTRQEISEEVQNYKTRESMPMQQMKNEKIKMKNSSYMLASRLDRAKERNSELKNSSTKEYPNCCKRRNLSEINT